MLRRILFLSLPLLALSPLGSQAKENDILSQTITDEAIIFPESFEADTQKMLEGWYMKNYTATDKRYATQGDVKATDDEIRQRLSAMPCVIEMPFNQIVRSYIDRYTQKGRAQVAAVLGLGNYYNPIFEQALEEEGLPLELKYLPVIESGLNPNAVSRHGATGLWQFMLGTAKGLGLDVNSLVDERRDPYLSSQKAAKYLKDLHSTYGDWSLAIAAYNCGPGVVNKAIRRAGGDASKQDFWSIYQYLPAETRGYVPMFIAANYVMNYYPKHNISPVLPTKPLVTDTVGVSRRVHFDQISNVLNISKDELRVLNPQFRADVVPGSPEHPYMLILPSQQVHAYIMSEDDIYNYMADRYRRRDVVEPGENPDATGDLAVAEEPLNPADLAPAEEAVAIAQVEADDNEEEEVAPVQPQAAAGKKRTVNHKVANGETLAEIATMYGVSATDIRHWNSLRRNAVRPGQLLRIETTVPERNIATARRDVAEQPAAAAAPAKTQSSAKQTPAKSTKQQTAAKKKAAKPKQQDHTVSSGENLSTIAKKYGVSVEELKKANAGAGDMIHPGDKLKVPAKSTGSKGKTSKKKKSKKRRR